MSLKKSDILNIDTLFSEQVRFWMNLGYDILTSTNGSQNGVDELCCVDLYMKSTVIRVRVIIDMGHTAYSKYGVYADSYTLVVGYIKNPKLPHAHWSFSSNQVEYLRSDYIRLADKKGCDKRLCVTPEVYLRDIAPLKLERIVNRESNTYYPLASVPIDDHRVIEIARRYVQRQERTQGAHISASAITVVKQYTMRNTKHHPVGAAQYIITCSCPFSVYYLSAHDTVVLKHETQYNDTYNGTPYSTFTFPFHCVPSPENRSKFTSFP